MSGAPPVPPPAPPPPSITNPIQPPATPPPAITRPSPPPSPFDARPRTYAPRYAPRYNLPPGNPRRGGYSPYYPGFVGFDDQTSPIPPDAAVYPVDSNGQPIPYPYPPTREQPQVVVPHAPDTFYVIPGCYAGNRPPNRERLPKGCDIAKLKATPVR